MAIAFDAAGPANQFNNSTTSLTFSHTCTGSDRILLVGVLVGGSTDPTGATYNGSAMTLVSSRASGYSNYNTSLWRLVAPATGSNSVVISRSGTGFVYGCSVSYTGVDQTTPLGTAATAYVDDPATPITVDATSASGEVVIDAAGWTFGNGGGLTAGAGQTKRTSSEDTVTTGHVFGMSEEAGAGTVTMSWTQGANSRPWGTVAVAMKPVAATATSIAYNLAARLFSILLPSF